MQAYSHSGPASTVASLSDLDGYTLPFHSYTTADNDDFGFDPPAEKSSYPRMEQTYSPPEPTDSMLLGEWPDFERHEDQKHLRAYEIDKLISQNLPNATNAISRYGQVTPPRTSSTDSGMTTASNSASPNSTTAPERRKRTSKAQAKEESAGNTAITTSSGRKRKATRKAAAAAHEPYDQQAGPDDSKRKASLEKNRLAAAKCRINKKEKTEQLQRDSHDKAVHNAFLKDQVMQMKEQIQQMNAVLLAHANSDSCKAPDEIQKHLGQLSTDFLADQMHSTMNAPAYGDYPQMSLEDIPPISQAPMMSDSYFSNLNSELPPLPDFDRSVDFETNTPMATD